MNKGTWLLTFTDLVCLVLTFFVMTYAMAIPDHGRWKEVNAGFSTRLAPAPDARKPRPEAAATIATTTPKHALRLEYLSRLLESQFSRDADLATLPLPGFRDGRLILTVPQERVFLPQEPRVTEEGRRLLFTLCEVLSRIDNRITVAAYTDPDPADPLAFRYRWEMALGRGLTVASLLEEAGYRQNIAVIAGTDANRSDQPVPERRLEIMIRDAGEE